MKIHAKKNNKNLDTENNIFHKIKEKITEIKYYDFTKAFKNKNSGFDFIILPNKNRKIFLIE